MKKLLRNRDSFAMIRRCAEGQHRPRSLESWPWALLILSVAALAFAAWVVALAVLIP